MMGACQSNAYLGFQAGSFSLCSALACGLLLHSDIDIGRACTTYSRPGEAMVRGLHTERRG